MRLRGLMIALAFLMPMAGDVYAATLKLDPAWQLLAIAPEQSLAARTSAGGAAALRLDVLLARLAPLRSG